MICEVLDISKSAHYQRDSSNVSARQLEDDRLLLRIKELHAANYFAYGYRRMHKLLLRKGERVGRDRVKRLMRQNGICGAKNRGKKRGTTQPSDQAPGRPDLVERNFQANAPNLLWVTDFTLVNTWERVCYFAFVIDVFSRQVIGWQLATHRATSLVLDALNMALGYRKPQANIGLIHHSDHGSQYTSIDYTKILTDNEIRISLGTVGDAYDNALAESFVDSYKTELINDRVWRTVTQLELETSKYISWFNNQRLHEALGDIPPTEFEQHFTQNKPL